MKPAEIIAKYGSDQDFCPICDKDFVDSTNAEFVVKLHKNQFGDWVAIPHHYRCYELDPIRQFRMIMGDEVESPAPPPQPETKAKG